MSINIDRVDECITVALANLKYSDEAIKHITLEVDRILYELDPEKVARKALKVNKRVFSEMFS